MNLRTMTTADIPAGMRLKDLAGWNQTPADWRCFLQSSPRGCFAAEVDGEVVGTAATMVYEQRFAWIGMVLVDPEFRGQGIGTCLLRKTIEHLDEIAIRTMKARPPGRPCQLRVQDPFLQAVERSTTACGPPSSSEWGSWARG